MKETVVARFFSKVDQAGSCWEWRAGTNGRGYGIFFLDGRKYSAHRISFEHFYGPIALGLGLDHLCRNTRCVNPTHLEAVTQGENVRRGSAVQLRASHCPRGHEYDLVNTYVNSRGKRECRACWRIKYLKRRAA